MINSLRANHAYLQTLFKSNAPQSNNIWRRNDAASHISSAAELQKKYYEAKLEMAYEKHAAKMRILHLKEEVLKKKLYEE